MKANKTQMKLPPAAPVSAEGQARVHEQIAIRAHEMWQQAGGGHGNDKTHWLQADRELRERQSSLPKKSTKP